jgi:hypothetical protein
MEIVSRKFADSRPVEQRKRHGRSRISNHPDLLPGVDGRSYVYRRFRDICTAIASDQGGASTLSEARLQLVRRFSAACVLAERMESDLANGKDINVERHALLCSTLTRLAQRIGIDRRARTLNPTVADYLAGKGAETATGNGGDVEAME